MSQHETVQIAEADVRDIVGAVTSSFLQLHAAAARPPWGPPGDVWTGCVAVDGEWCGAVLLTVTPRFARRAAQIMFDRPAPDISEEAARDALGELTNVIGGNLKSLFASVIDAPCRLSLPMVANGRLDVPGARTLGELWSACGEDLIGLTLLEKIGSPVRGSRFLEAGLSG